MNKLMNDSDTLEPFIQNDTTWFLRFIKQHPDWLETCLNSGPEWLKNFMQNNPTLVTLLSECTHGLSSEHSLQNTLTRYLMRKPNLILSFMDKNQEITSKCLADSSILRNKFSINNSSEWICLHCHTVNQSYATSCEKCGIDKEHGETGRIENPYAPSDYVKNTNNMPPLIHTIVTINLLSNTKTNT